MKIMKFMFGKMNLKRKGITPVIAIVLLLMMTVAAAGMAYVWIMSLQEDISEDTERDLANLNKQKNARLEVAAVWNNGGGAAGGKIDVMVKNAGTYVFTTDDQANIQVMIGDEILSNCVVTAQGTTCTFNGLVTLFPSVAGSTGAVKIKVISPVGLGDTYVCSVPTDGIHMTC